ncbi:MAG: (d)CMP kinase [Lachnospiraceae bacterium]|nr:(d)CMP kinase [Lachnospiraceae bacterium]
MNFQIVIDGPASAGKSTIAKEVARHLQYVYIDSGAMYRAMGLYLESCNINLDSEEEITRVCKGAEITIHHIEGCQQIYLNGEKVTEQMRTEKAGMLASKISVYPEVRRKLMHLQQKIGRIQNIVMDGRDIGTTVLPEAPLKIYLTANIEIRAKRRFLELQAKGVPVNLAEIKADIEKRDAQDMYREMSPLCRAKDAIYLDSSNMIVEEIVNEILRLHRQVKLN